MFSVSLKIQIEVFCFGFFLSFSPVSFTLGKELGRVFCFSFGGGVVWGTFCLCGIFLML